MVSSIRGFVEIETGDSCRARCRVRWSTWVRAATRSATAIEREFTQFLKETVLRPLCAIAAACGIEVGIDATTFRLPLRLGPIEIAFVPFGARTYSVTGCRDPTHDFLASLSVPSSSTTT